MLCKTTVRLTVTSDSQLHVSCEHGSPNRAQVPQLGLQQTRPVLQVAIPQVALNGYSMGLPHCLAVSHSSPGRMQIPQLLLQHNCPTLHVFEPHETLSTSVDMPHTCCEHSVPGVTQVPQLALQHTSRSGHCVLPHCTLITAGAAATRLGIGCATVTSAVANATATVIGIDGADTLLLDILGDSMCISLWLDATGVTLGFTSERWLKRTHVLRAGVSSETAGAARDPK